MIHILFTGGTISMQRDAAAGGNVPAHGGEALVRLAPGIERIAPFRIEDWARMPACHFGPDRLWALRERVRELAESGEVSGIVITHGTDILEETAYLLDRTLDRRVPVALTGAMRTSSDDGWDGPRNLRDAVTVAASPSSAGRGAMVVFAGQVFAGAHRGEEPCDRRRRVLRAARRADRAGGRRSGDRTPRRREATPAPIRLDVASRAGGARADGGGRRRRRARPRPARARRRGDRGLRQRQRAARRRSGHRALAGGGEAGGAREPLLVGPGDAGLRLRRRRRAHHGDGRDPGRARARRPRRGWSSPSRSRPACRTARHELPRAGAGPRGGARDRPGARGRRPRGLVRRRGAPRHAAGRPPLRLRSRHLGHAGGGAAPVPPHRGDRRSSTARSA